MRPQHRTLHLIRVHGFAGLALCFDCNTLSDCNGRIRRSQHAFTNPAITIILRMGGAGVPPLGSTPDGILLQHEFPCTAQQFFNLLLNDGSQFTSKYRSLRKDTNLVMGQWHTAEEYDGQVREITFRSLCNRPMCPPDTAMTEWQHFVLSPDKKKLVFETVQLAHDVPFGSYFEVHCKWSLETTTESSSTLEIKVDAHFKKWCVMQSKIKSGTVKQYKKEVKVMLDVARSYIKSHGSDDETDKANISGDLR